MELFFILLIAVVCAVVANNKNRSEIGWFIAGLLFSIIALIIVALLPPKEQIL